jgi:hypothetical protein
LLSVVTDPNLPTITQHTLTFNRIASWPGLFKHFTVRVFDDTCDPALQTEVSFNLSTTQFVDLRPIAETQLSELFAQGWIVLQPGNPSLPDLLIDDELVIDVPASIIGDVNAFRDVTLMPGASIRIATDNPGGGLTPNLFATETNIHTCPGAQLAEGIVVDPMSSVGFPLTKLNVQNSIISDCRHGINAKPNSSIRLENNQFINNYIGARFDMTGAPTGQERVRIDGFSGNTFLSDGQLKQPFPGMPEAVETRGYCGIYANNYRDFNVWGGNHFSRLANGIVAYKSTGNLGNMTFNDMNSAGNAYPFEGFGIYLAGKTLAPQYFNINEFWTSMTFDNCKTGILAYNHALNVENAQMTNVDVGIDVLRSQTKDIVLDGNTITARKYGIRSFLNEPVHDISAIRNNIITVTGLGAGTAPVTGIEMEEGAFSLTLGGGWEVSGNDVAMQRGGYGISYRNGMFASLQDNDVNNLGMSQSGPYKGIRAEAASFTQIDFNDVTQSLSASGNATSQAIQSAAGWANGFTCNCVDNTGVGLQFYDLADFTDNVRGNKFNDHDDTGLQLGDDVQGNTYIGTQYHTGNEWVLAAIPAGGFGGVNWGTSLGVVGQSTFFVDPNEKGGALNPPVDPDEWFDPQVTIPPSFDCSNSCSAPATPPPFTGEGDVPTRLDAAIATGTLPTDGWAAETNWKGAYRLYRKMLRRPAIENYAPEYAAFKSANANLSTGKLAYIAEEKSKLFELTSTEYTTAENYRTTLRQQIADINALDIQRQSGGTVNEGQYNTLVQQSAVTRTQFEQYLESLETARQQKVQNLLTLNSAVSTSLVPDANHKTVNGIMLNMLANEGEFASTDLTTLTAIADQCPLEGGDAVYEARAVVAYLTGQEFDDYQLCDSGERNQRIKPSVKVESLDNIIVYPNPTTGQVFWTTLQGEPVTVRVFNSLGQLQIEKSTTDNRMDLSALSQGMYHLQILSPAQTVLFSGNISLLK